MTQEEKQQLWECICEMVPHDTIVHHLNVNADYKLNGVLNNTLPINGEKELLIYVKTLDNGIQLPPTGPGDVLPYLRPMSSMTEEEKIELCTISYAPDEMKTIEEKLYVIQTNAKNAADFYNAHYLDYRGLIEKGLALEAPEGMYNAK